MRAWTKAAIAFGVALALLAVAQVVLPGLGERRIEDRLTEGGGSAEARLSATPAARLLWSDGDSIEITGSGLDLDLADSDPVVFDRLDGFSDVSVELTDFRAGPFDVSGFELRREGSGPYALRSSSTTTAADLVASGADALGVAGGGLLGFLAGRAPGSDTQIPIELDMEMESDDGRIRVVSGGGTVNGYETDSLAQFITAAIVVRL